MELGAETWRGESPRGPYEHQCSNSKQVKAARSLYLTLLSHTYWASSTGRNRRRERGTSCAHGTWQQPPTTNRPQQSPASTNNQPLPTANHLQPTTTSIQHPATTINHRQPRATNNQYAATDTKWPRQSNALHTKLQSPAGWKHGGVRFLQEPLPFNI